MSSINHVFSDRPISNPHAAGEPSRTSPGNGDDRFEPLRGEAQATVDRYKISPGLGVSNRILMAQAAVSALVVGACVAGCFLMSFWFALPAVVTTFYVLDLWVTYRDSRDIRPWVTQDGRVSDPAISALTKIPPYEQEALLRSLGKCGSDITPAQAVALLDILVRLPGTQRNIVLKMIRSLPGPQKLAFADVFAGVSCTTRTSMSFNSRQVARKLHTAPVEPLERLLWLRVITTVDPPEAEVAQVSSVCAALTPVARVSVNSALELAVAVAGSSQALAELDSLSDSLMQLGNLPERELQPIAKTLQQLFRVFADFSILTHLDTVRGMGSQLNILEAALREQPQGSIVDRQEQKDVLAELSACPDFAAARKCLNPPPGQRRYRGSSEVLAMLPQNLRYCAVRLLPKCFIGAPPDLAAFFLKDVLEDVPATHLEALIQVLLDENRTDRPRSVDATRSSWPTLSDWQALSNEDPVMRLRWAMSRTRPADTELAQPTQPRREFVMGRERLRAMGHVSAGYAQFRNSRSRRHDPVVQEDHGRNENVMHTARREAVRKSTERLDARFQHVDSRPSLQLIASSLKQSLQQVRDSDAESRLHQISDAEFRLDHVIKHLKAGRSINLDQPSSIIRLLETVWVAIETYKAPNNDVSATKTEQSNMRLGLAKMLADCVQGNSRSLVCGYGMRERILTPLNGVIPEVQLVVVTPEEIVNERASALQIKRECEQTPLTRADLDVFDRDCLDFAASVYGTHSPLYAQMRRHINFAKMVLQEQE